MENGFSGLVRVDGKWVTRTQEPANGWRYWCLVLLAVLLIGAAGVAPVLLSPRTVREFGARGDGVTDDSAAFQRAIDAQVGTVYVPWTSAGYSIAASVIVKSNTFMSGLGGRARLVMAQSFASGYMLDCGTNSNISFSNLELDGGSNQTFNATVSAGTRSALKLYSNGNITVEDLDIHGFDQYSYIVTAQISSALPIILTNNNTYVSNTKIHNCFRGPFYNDSSAEYQLATGLDVRNCAFGIEVDSGNVMIGNSKFVLNTLGAYIGGSINNGHGSFVNCQLTHNTTTVWFQGVAVGFTFDGCTLFSGDIKIDNCVGVQVANCIFDVPNLTVLNGGSGNRFHNNWCADTAANTIANPAGACSFINNPRKNGGWVGAPGFVSDGINTDVGLATGLIVGTNVHSELRMGPAVSSNGLFQVAGGPLPQGRMLAGNSNVSLPITYALVLSNKTANYQILPTESGSIFSNKGTAGVTTNMLPNNPTNGVHFYFVVQTNQALWIQGTNARIRSAASVSTNSGWLTSSTIGSTAELVAISTNEWYAVNLLGTWTFQ